MPCLDMDFDVVLQMCKVPHNQRDLPLLGCLAIPGLISWNRRLEANKCLYRSSRKPVVCLRQQDSHSLLELVTEAEQSCIVYEGEEPMFLCTSV